MSQCPKHRIGVAYILIWPKEKNNTLYCWKPYCLCKSIRSEFFLNILKNMSGLWYHEHSQRYWRKTPIWSISRHPWTTNRGFYIAALLFFWFKDNSFWTWHRFLFLQQNLNLYTCPRLLYFFPGWDMSKRWWWITSFAVDMWYCNTLHTVTLISSERKTSLKCLHGIKYLFWKFSFVENEFNERMRNFVHFHRKGSGTLSTPKCL